MVYRLLMLQVGRMLSSITNTTASRTALLVARSPPNRELTPTRGLTSTPTAAFSGLRSAVLMTLDSRDGSNVLTYPRKSLRSLPGNGGRPIGSRPPTECLSLFASQPPSTADNVCTVQDAGLIGQSMHPWQCEFFEGNSLVERGPAVPLLLWRTGCVG